VVFVVQEEVDAEADGLLVLLDEGLFPFEVLTLLLLLLLLLV
jgi:hypothetical protein